MDRERFDRLRLIRSPRIGPVTYRQLLSRFGTAAEALRAVPDLARRGGGQGFTLADPAKIEREMAAVAKLGASYLLLGDPDYPALLGELDNAPAALIVRGDVGLAHRRCVALVGARNASAVACRFARGLAQDLAARHVIVVSGLARGIDTSAHQGALRGGTVAVIASGIDVSFPPENASLQEEIAQQGLLIAEHPPGTEPLARHFPARNRIIAGLSLATVVIEAAPKSGSLITARLAAEMGREVLAVPGSPLDPRAQGCNQLIREGATLIQNADDILEAIAPIDARMVRQERQAFIAPGSDADVDDAARDRIFSLLSITPVPIDEIIRQSGLAPATVNIVLVELELAGRVVRHAGGRIALA